MILANEVMVSYHLMIIMLNKNTWGIHAPVEGKE